MSSLPGIITAITADGLALLMGQPPTATLSELTGVGYQSWLRKKARVSHEILFDELRKGNRIASDFDPDTFFGLLHRYLNATKQGAAQRNLRLMAQVLAGSLEQDCPFKPDKLASFADLVASLTRDEIKFLAVFWSSHNDSTNAPLESVDQNIQGEERIKVSTAAMALERLVPNICSTKLEFDALGGSLTRTGLIVAQSVWGGTSFDITPRLSELVQLTNLERVLDPLFEN